MPADAAGPLGGDRPAIDLPPLDETDPLVRRLVRELSSHPRVVAWLATDDLIRSFTIAVQNVADGVIVGSHLVRLIEEHGGDRDLPERLEARVRELAGASKPGALEAMEAW